MADFGTIIRVALIFGLAALLKDLLDTVLDGMGVTSATCTTTATSSAVNTARNCAYVSDTAQWAIAVVAVSLVVLTLQRAIVSSQVP